MVDDGRRMESLAEVPKEHDHVKWFREHYEEAPRQIVDFLQGGGVALGGVSIADVGCGDGVIDLGVAHLCTPSNLVGYDIRKTDVAALRRAAAASGVNTDALDERVTFVESMPTEIPSVSDAFDVAFSWSVFEHVADPVPLLKEVRRILKPGGAFFLQVWPLFLSEHGGHLWLSDRSRFPHLRESPWVIAEDLGFATSTDPTRPADDEFRSLNRLTVDSLQRALLAAGLVPVRVELVTGAVHVPEDLAYLPLTDLAISGLKLLAVPRP